jgi:ABC-2 type transport system permease protein
LLRFARNDIDKNQKPRIEIMFKFFAAFRKEWLILTRDVAGLIVLFLMPMVMVIILTLVQEFGWNAISKEPTVPILFVDEDHDSLAAMIHAGLEKANMFKLITRIDTMKVDREIARQRVSKGEYQIAVIIPEGATKLINRKINVLVTKIVSGIMMPVNNPFLDIAVNDSVNVIIYFDPAVKGTFKNAFTSTMREYSLKIESSMIFNSFGQQLKKMFPQYKPEKNSYKESVFFTEEFPSGNAEEKIPDSTQHNIPSWAIFAMFFIVIPLTSSIIKEREEGSLIRIHTLPVNYLTIFMAKVGVYLVVCFIQFVLMVMAGILILPLFGMPVLDISGNQGTLAVMAIVSSLAALGYGIMVGTIARTHQQAAAFGSVSVVILAALGGLWVPVYFFTDAMKTIAGLSPLNWAHQGFIDILLRGSSLPSIMPEITKLLIFFVVTIAIAAVYRKIKPPIG